MSDYEKLHARISQLVERNTGLADLANERGYEIDALKAENESLRDALVLLRDHDRATYTQLEVINAALNRSPENH